MFFTKLEFGWFFADKWLFVFVLFTYIIHFFYISVHADINCLRLARHTVIYSGDAKSFIYLQKTPYLVIVNIELINLISLSFEQFTQVFFVNKDMREGTIIYNNITTQFWVVCKHIITLILFVVWDINLNRSWLSWIIE